MISSQICSVCVTAKWRWCFVCRCGCSKGCGWRSRPAHMPLQYFTDQTSQSSKTQGFLPSPEPYVQNHPLKWVRGFEDAYGPWQSDKQMEDAEHSNMGGKFSEHFFGQAIVTVSLHMSINKLCVQASRSSSLISCPVIWIDATSPDFFSAVIRSVLHIYME